MGMVKLILFLISRATYLSLIKRGEYYIYYTSKLTSRRL